VQVPCALLCDLCHVHLLLHISTSMTTQLLSLGHTGVREEKVAGEGHTIQPMLLLYSQIGGLYNTE
jgi:hypothetical protein